jgi:hypothetical protein
MNFAMFAVVVSMGLRLICRGEPQAVCTDQGRKIFIPVMPAILIKNGAFSGAMVKPRRRLLGGFWDGCG